MYTRISCLQVSYPLIPSQCSQCSQCTVKLFVCDAQRCSNDGIMHTNVLIYQWKSLLQKHSNEFAMQNLCSRLSFVDKSHESHHTQCSVLSLFHSFTLRRSVYRCEHNPLFTHTLSSHHSKQLFTYRMNDNQQIQFFLF